MEKLENAQQRLRGELIFGIFEYNFNSEINEKLVIFSKIKKIRRVSASEIQMVEKEVQIFKEKLINLKGE